jgi:hypothetical protein
MDLIWEAILVLMPTVVLGLIFWFVMRNVLNSDKNERKAYAQVEAEERARRGLPPAST